MGNLFSADQSVGLVLTEVLGEEPDTTKYGALGALPGALGEVNGYAATSDAHQEAMRVLWCAASGRCGGMGLGAAPRGFV